MNCEYSPGAVFTKLHLFHKLKWAL